MRTYDFGISKHIHSGEDIIMNTIRYFLMFILMFPFFIKGTSSQAQTGVQMQRERTQVPSTKTIDYDVVLLPPGRLSLTRIDEFIPPEWRGAQRSDGLFLIQFRGPIQKGWLEEIESEGFEVLHPYFPPYTKIVYVPRGKISWLMARPYIRWVGRYHPFFKFHDPVRGLEDGIYRVFIRNRADIDALLRRVQAEGMYIHSTHFDATFTPPYFRIEATSSQLRKLAFLEDVWFIEKQPYFEPFLTVARSMVQAGDGQACSADSTRLPLWSAGITGAGPAPSSNGSPGTEQLVGILDTHFNHPDLGCTGSVPNDTIFRYVEYNNASTSCRPVDQGSCIVRGVFHGTAVAGIIAGSGFKDGGEEPMEACVRKGIAFGARLWLMNCDGIDNALSCLNYCDSVTSLTDFFELSTTDGSRLSNHSWGAATGGSYTLEAELVDSTAYDNDPSTQALEQYYVWDFAAGNSGPNLQTIGSPATAKNDISVAGHYNGINGQCWPGDSPPCDEELIVKYSSVGPTADGRHGPDITAPTQIISAPNDIGTYGNFNGTSAATPTTTAAVTLLRDWLVHVQNIAQPSAPLIKAFLLNSGDYVPRHLLYPNESLPGKTQGWGRINLSNLCDDFSSVNCNTIRSIWEEGTFQNTGEESSFSLAVHDSSVPLRCMLVWFDPPNFPTGALINDLDLWLEDPNGTCYPGNSFSGAWSVAGSCGGVDTVNTDEGVRIQNPIQGSWTVHVRSASLNQSPQPWAVVCSGSISRTPLLTTPEQLSVCNATPASAQTTVKVYGGPGALNGIVTLTYNGSTPPEAGISVTYSPSVVDLSSTNYATSTMDIGVASSVTEGEYLLETQATDTVNTFTTITTLRVFSTTPDIPVPNQPQDGTFVDMNEVYFSWDGVPTAESYTLVIYEGRDCNGPVVGTITGISGTSYLLTSSVLALQPQTEYSWVVQAENACGVSTGMCQRFHTYNCFTTKEIVVNGDFETGTLNGWTIESARGWPGIPGVTTTDSYDGFYALQLGHVPAYPATTYAGEDAVSQDIQVPQSGAVLTFRVRFATWERSAGYDVQRADVLDMSGRLLLNIFTYGDNEPPAEMGDWKEYTVDLSPWAGQTIRLRFSVFQDTVYHTGMLIDGVTTVRTECPAPDYTLRGPDEVQVCAGNTTGFKIAVESKYEYPWWMMIWPSDLLPGMDVQFYPAQFSVQYKKEVQAILNTSSTTRSGLHTMSIQGEGWIDRYVKNKSLSLQVRIATHAPFRPLLITPENNSSVFTTTPTFTWGTIIQPSPDETNKTQLFYQLPLGMPEPKLGSQDTMYHLLVDDDLAFQSPEIDIQTDELSYKPPLNTLSSQTQYYWKVAATNACGESGPSDVWTFSIAGCQREWDSVPPIPEPRWAGCTVPWGDSIVTLGGYSSTGQILSTAFQYDPSTDTYSSFPSLPEQLAFMGCAIHNGRIYVVGGLLPIGYSNHVWIFEPSVMNWVQGPDLPFPVRGPAVADVNGTLFVCGGLASQGGIGMQALETCYKLSDDGSSWVPAFTMKAKRYDARAIELGGSLYIVGSNVGFDVPALAVKTIERCDITASPTCTLSSSSPYNLNTFPAVGKSRNDIYIAGIDPGDGTFTTVLRYDTLRDTFEVFEPMMSGHGYPSGAVLNGFFYVVSGRSSGFITTADVERYRFCEKECTGTWESITTLPEGRAWACSVVVNNEIYVIGGSDMEQTPTQTVYKYDPGTQTWTLRSALPEPLFLHGCAWDGTSIHVVGGWNGVEPTNRHFVYNPVLDAWSELNPIPFSVMGHALEFANGNLYLCGGFLSQTQTASNECYVWDESTDTWSLAGFQLQLKRWRVGSTADGSKIYIIGSHTGMGEDPLSPYTLEICDTLTEVCRLSRPTVFPLTSNPGAAVVSGELYILGVKDTSNLPVLALKYSPISDTFSLFEPLALPQNNTTAEYLNGLLYLFGGYNGQTLGISTVQQYLFCSAESK